MSGGARRPAPIPGSPLEFGLPGKLQSFWDERGWNFVPAAGAEPQCQRWDFQIPSQHHRDARQSLSERQTCPENFEKTLCFIFPLSFFTCCNPLNLQSFFSLHSASPFPTSPLPPISWRRGMPERDIPYADVRSLCCRVGFFPLVFPFPFPIFPIFPFFSLGSAACSHQSRLLPGISPEHPAGARDAPCMWDRAAALKRFNFNFFVLVFVGCEPGMKHSHGICENPAGCFGRVSFIFVSPSLLSWGRKEGRRKSLCCSISFTSLLPQHKAFLFLKDS